MIWKKAKLADCQEKELVSFSEFVFLFHLLLTHSNFSKCFTFLVLKMHPGLCIKTKLAWQATNVLKSWLKSSFKQLRIYEPQILFLRASRSIFPSFLEIFLLGQVGMVLLWKSHHVTNFCYSEKGQKRQHCEQILSAVLSQFQGTWGLGRVLSTVSFRA